MKMHSLVRTNEKGVPGIGKCVKCHKENIKLSDLQNDDCEFETLDEDIVDAITGASDPMTDEDREWFDRVRYKGRK